MSRSIYKILLLLYSALILSACSPLQLLSAIADDGHQSSVNQAYGPERRQELTVYVPRNVEGNADVVIFYYGGRWQSGDKKQYAFVADALTAKGFIVVLPDYRLYPSVGWRDFIQDGASAYQWVYRNIARYHGNPKRIFVMGHSSGAHIAAMINVKESLLKQGIKRPCGFVGLAGPYDFLPIADADVQQVFSSATDLRNTQPINYVSKGDPVMLLLHGKDDTTVKPGNATRLAERVKQFGDHVDLKLYDDLGHIGLLISLSSTFRGYSPALEDSVTFMRKVECLAGL